MMEHLLYQKHSKSLIEDEVYPPLEPMESLSTTRRDYKQEGFLSVPPPPTQGTSSIRTGDTPFKKCATFTTPVPEHLGQPLPYDSENCPKL
ncbi:sperm-associated antigen 8 isoform X3 [Python bivittatus]|uniref:Sperm-associated antigen 8 isoform X3 n=1 Tax=Python bivittatus TaxID=176946 RepID=A0A9F5N4U0_PYTBI|nr:sperm-associated antigen 8 isoform X3 [Python bivittatus]